MNSAPYKAAWPQSVAKTEVICAKNLALLTAMSEAHTGSMCGNLLTAQQRVFVIAGK